MGTSNAGGDSGPPSAFVRCDRHMLSTRSCRAAATWHLSLVSAASLLFAGDDNEVFMTISLNVDNRTEFNNDKSEAPITNNKRLHSRYCTVEANKTDLKHRAASLREQSYLSLCSASVVTVNRTASDVKITITLPWHWSRPIILFLPRDAMRSADITVLLKMSIRPSVRLSLTPSHAG